MDSMALYSRRIFNRGINFKPESFQIWVTAKQRRSFAMHKILKQKNHRPKNIKSISPDLGIWCTNKDSQITSL